jgi:hypothetical protein
MKQQTTDRKDTTQDALSKREPLCVQQLHPPQPKLPIGSSG